MSYGVPFIDSLALEDFVTYQKPPVPVFESFKQNPSAEESISLDIKIPSNLNDDDENVVLKFPYVELIVIAVLQKEGDGEDILDLEPSALNYLDFAENNASMCVIKNIVITNNDIGNVIPVFINVNEFGRYGPDADNSNIEDYDIHVVSFIRDTK